MHLVLLWPRYGNYGSFRGGDNFIAPFVCCCYSIDIQGCIHSVIEGFVRCLPGAVELLTITAYDVVMIA